MIALILVAVLSGCMAQDECESPRSECLNFFSVMEWCKTSNVCTINDLPLGEGPDPFTIPQAAPLEFKVPLGKLRGPQDVTPQVEAYAATRFYGRIVVSFDGISPSPGCAIDAQTVGPAACAIPPGASEMAVLMSHHSPKTVAVYPSLVINIYDEACMRLYSCPE